MERKNGVAAFALSGSVLTYDFGTAGMVTVDVAGANLFPQWATMTECQQRLVINGAKQRLADGFAGAKTAAERFTKTSRIGEDLNNGIYSSRAASGRVDITDAILAAAIVVVTGKPLPAVVKYLATATAEAKLALAENPRFKGQIQELLAERTKTVDVSKLDAEIDAIPD